MTTPTGALDPTEVQVGTANGPGIYIAPVGTAGPVDTTSDWPVGWSVLGYLSDDGPTIAQSTESEDITPWQSVTPIRSVITSRGVTVQFTMWQLNAETLALYFDTDAATPDPTTGALSMDIRTDSPQHIYAIGVDSADADRVLRIIYPRASLSDAGDMQIQRGAAVPLDVTLSALDDGGVLAKILLGPAVADSEAPLTQSAEDFLKIAKTVGEKQERDTGRRAADTARRTARDHAHAHATTGTGGAS